MNDHKRNLADGMTHEESQKSMFYGRDVRQWTRKNLLASSGGDTGCDPIGPNENGEFMFKMYPSGDIVNTEEKEKRLRK